jgi:integrase
MRVNHTITFEQAAERMLADMEAKKKVKAATLRATRSRLNAINGVLGSLPLSRICGADVKAYIESRIAAGKSGATVRWEHQVIRTVIQSIVDKNLNCLFPIQWKTQNLELPSTKPSKDRTPCTSRESIEAALAANLRPYSQLVAFLAFTGMRLGEGVACRIGTDDPKVTHWNPEASLIRVRTSFDLDEHSAKTERSADRIVDLCSDANDFLKLYAGDRRDGFLFMENEKPLERNRLYRAAAKLCGPYHGLRRARITHLYSRMETPAEEQIIKFWVGHESHESTQTERYSKLWQDAAWRRDFAERAGVGFLLPVSVRPAQEEAVLQVTT